MPGFEGDSAGAALAASPVPGWLLPSHCQRTVGFGLWPGSISASSVDQEETLDLGRRRNEPCRRRQNAELTEHSSQFGKVRPSAAAPQGVHPTANATKRQSLRQTCGRRRATAICSFSYLGVETAAVAAGRVRDPEHNGACITVGKIQLGT